MFATIQAIIIIDFIGKHPVIKSKTAGVHSEYYWISLNSNNNIKELTGWMEPVSSLFDRRHL